MDILAFILGLITGGKGKVDPSDATATAGDILSPKTAYVAGGKVTGQIQSQAAQTITPTTADQTVPAGKYLSGAQTIKGSANLVAGNIKKDVEIFGILGDYAGTDVSDTTAVASDVLDGKDFYLANGTKASGSIQSQAAQTIHPSTQDQTIPAGKYLSGAQTVKAVVVSNTLIAANVADGVTVTIGDADDPDRIMEVVGTHQGGGGDADLDSFIQGTLTALVTDATSLRNYAAYQNTGLTSVTAAEATSIGDYAFQGCSNLASASFPKTLYVGDSAFYNDSNLTFVDIPLVTNIGRSSFSGCTKLTFANNELLAKSISPEAFTNAARQTNGFAWKPRSSGAAAQGSAFYRAKVIEIDGANVTLINDYAFYGTEWLEDADFASAVVSTLGQYAFQNAGKSRADLTTPLVLDFHSGTFNFVNQYAFAGLVNTIITLSTTVTQLNANAFNGIDGCIVYITRTASVPTLSATTVFSGATNSFVALPYDNLYAALQNANWNAISSMVVGFAPAGTFVAGDTLPTTDSGSHDIYWSTDPAGAQWVTECPSGSPILYAHLGSKTGWWVDVDVTGATVSVVGSDSTVYPIVNGRATVPDGNTFDIEVTYPSGYDTSITLNGTTVTTFPITGLTADHDYVLSGRAWDPSAAGVDWATDSWELVQITSINGKTAQTYGSQVGATRTITLTNGNTMTIRLSNADDTMYARSDGSGTTGLCMDFADCFQDMAQMNNSGLNTGGWNACQMRTVKMAQLFDLLPSDLAAVIETADIPTANGGGGTISVVDSADKLFLLAEKEVFGTITYSVAAEADALTQWKWYQDHNTYTDRIKKRSGSNSNWWLRSTRSGNSYAFCAVNFGGGANYNDANGNYGVSPGFVI